jgi:hypothetical protein
MSCDQCEYRDECKIREQYRKAKQLYKEGDIAGLREISNLLELHESYMVEMRRDVNKKLVELVRKKRS